MLLQSLLALSLLTIPPTLSLLLSREFPHLIIPLYEDNPTTAYGTQYSGNVAIQGGAHQVYTEISFDVPSNAASTCTLDFAIATGNAGAPWTLSGTPPFLLNISALTPSISKDHDSWTSHPELLQQVGAIELYYDSTVTVYGGQVPCAKGQVAQFLLYPGSARDLDFTWFEEASPIHGITYAMYD